MAPKRLADEIIFQGWLQEAKKHHEKAYTKAHETELKAQKKDLRNHGKSIKKEKKHLLGQPQHSILNHMIKYIEPKSMCNLYKTALEVALNVSTVQGSKVLSKIVPYCYQ